jgi:hypothetical protein
MADYINALESYVIEDAYEYASEGLGDIFKKALEWVIAKIKKLKEIIVGLINKIFKRKKDVNVTTDENGVLIATSNKKSKKNKDDKNDDKEEDTKIESVDNNTSEGKLTNAIIKLFNKCSVAFKSVDKLATIVRKFAKVKVTDKPGVVFNKILSQVSKYKLLDDGLFVNQETEPVAKKIEEVEEAINSFNDEYGNDNSKIQIKDLDKITRNLNVFKNELEKLEKEIDGLIAEQKRINPTNNFRNAYSKFGTVKELDLPKLFDNIDKLGAELPKLVSKLLKHVTSVTVIVNKHCA